MKQGGKGRAARYQLGDGQLVKDGKGRYSPTNPTTNPRKADTYAEKPASVSGVSGVGEEPLSASLLPGQSAYLSDLKAERSRSKGSRDETGVHPYDCLCEECLPI
jgi:hypothetical protein